MTRIHTIAALISGALTIALLALGNTLGQDAYTFTGALALVLTSWFATVGVLSFSTDREEAAEAGTFTVDSHLAHGATA